MRGLALACLTAILFGCGGGSGSSNPPETIVPSHYADFGFWYTEPGQLDATYKNISVVFCQDDSTNILYGESLLIQCAQEAQARGIRKWIASVWPLIFTKDHSYRGSQDLAAFCAQLNELGITPEAIYLMDEPDLNLGVQAAGLIRRAATDARKGCPGSKIAAVYQRSTPGMDSLDWIGRDNGTDPGQLDNLPTLGPGQEYILVPYGSDSWREDPTPYITFAETHAVAAVLAFAWATFGQYLGIGVNGEAPQYLKAGCQITGLC